MTPETMVIETPITVVQMQDKLNHIISHLGYSAVITTRVVDGEFQVYAMGSVQ